MMEHENLFTNIINHTTCVLHMDGIYSYRRVCSLYVVHVDASVKCINVWIFKNRQPQQIVAATAAAIGNTHVLLWNRIKLIVKWNTKLYNKH